MLAEGQQPDGSRVTFTSSGSSRSSLTQLPAVSAEGQKLLREIDQRTKTQTTAAINSAQEVPIAINSYTSRDFPVEALFRVHFLVAVRI